MKKIGLTLITLGLICALLQAQAMVPPGQLGTPGELIFPQQMEEGPDGNLSVYDQADAFIKVYFPTGQFIRKIGGKGQGPGEIQRAEGVSFGFTSTGQLFFTEFFGGHPWITILGLDGTLDHVVKPQISEFFGVSKAFSLPGGKFLVEFSFLGQPEKEKDYFYHRTKRELNLMDGEGKIISQLMETSHITQISFIHDGGDSPLPFTPMFLWCPFEEESVLFSEGLESKLRVIDFSGKIIREIDTSLPEPEKVAKKDLEEWKKRRQEMMTSRAPTWWARFGRVIDNYKKSIYPNKPNIWDMRRTPQGRFLIGSRAEERELLRTYWLIDKEGKELAKFRSSAWVMGLSPNFIFLGEVDKDGNPSVKLVKRQGKEEDDLLRLSH